jgi:hypothetical protein
MVDNKIYTIGNHLRIYNLNFELLESKDNIYHEDLNCYSDLIVRDSKIVFFNSFTNKVLTFDVASRSIQQIKSF